MAISYQLAIFEQAFLDVALSAVPENLILYGKDVSWQGQLDWVNIADWLKRAKIKQKKLFFQLDAYLTPYNEQALLRAVEQILSLGFVPRIKDLGLAYWMKKNYPKQPFVFLFSNQGKNVFSWQALAQEFSTNLLAIVLSPEIPFAILQKMAVNFWQKFPNVRLEILGAGRLSVFYSARPLLPYGAAYQYLSVEKQSPWSGKGFTNSLGTRLEYERDIFWCDRLLEHRSFLSSYPLDVRLELPSQAEWSCFLTAFPHQDWATQLKKKWTRPTTLGFFAANKSDAQFRLFQKHSAKKQEKTEKKWVGEVLDYVPNALILVKITKQVTLPASFYFETPDRFLAVQKVSSAVLLASDQSFIELAPGIYRFPFVKRAVYQTQVYVDSLSTSNE